MVFVVLYSIRITYLGTVARGVVGSVLVPVPGIITHRATQIGLSLENKKDLAWGGGVF